jgi:electron transfer flavoprotein alpha subunit
MVIGSDCAEAGQAAAKIAGVARVLVADAAQLGDQLAENVAAQILAVAKDYTHILAPATATART